jgi:hypothetical protein
MVKLYIIIFSIDIDREQLIKYLETISGINFWFYNLPNSVFIKSTLDSKNISGLIESRFGLKNHVVIQMESYWGRVANDHVKYFKI